MSTTTTRPAPAPRRAARRSPEGAYDAFISYSHAADGRLAPRLEEGLERLAKPLLRPFALNVFRDDTGLSVTPELWPTIQRALDDSRYFILLASPGAAASSWVNDEVEHWLTETPAAKEGKAASRLLIAVTAGEIRWNRQAGRFDETTSTALPPRLCSSVFKHEPLWVDLRGAHTQEDLSLQNAYFRGKVADLAATLHGKSKDELIGEDVRLARRNRRLAWTASTLLALLAVVATSAAVTATRERDRATSRALAATAVAQLDTDPRESLSAAIRAVETALTDEAVATLREALIRSALIAELRADSGRIDSAVFSPDGERIVARVALPGGRGYLQTWDAETGVRGCMIPRADLRHFTADSAAMVAADGRVLDVRTCKPLQRDTAEGMVLTPRLQVVGEHDRSQEVRDTRTGALVIAIPSTIEPVAGAVASPGGRQVVTWPVKGLIVQSGGGPSERGEKFARVWTLWASEFTDRDLPPAGNRLFGHRRAIYAASFGENVIATGSDDRTVRIWTRRVATDDWEEAAVLPGHRAAVVGVALGPRDDRVVSVDASGTARVWQTGNGTVPLATPAEGFRQAYDRRLPALRGPRPVGVPVLTRDGRRVVAAVGDLRITSWSAATGTRVGPVLDLGRYFSSVSVAPTEVENLAGQLSPDGTRLVLPRGNRDILPEDTLAVVVDLATGAVAGTLHGHQGPVYAAAYRPDGLQIATGGNDGTVRLWDARTFAAGRKLQLPGTRVLHVAFSPDGRRMVVTTLDALVRIWELETNRLLELFGHEGDLRQAFFSPDAALVVSVGDDGVRVWDARSGKMLRRYLGGDITWARLSPGCDRVVVGVDAGGEEEAHTLPFGACGPVERMMGLARGRIRAVAAVARPPR